MFELKIIKKFAAAHQLKMVAKKCENLHGHNWKIEVCVRGQSLNDAGVIMDFAEIKDRLAQIIEKLDHTFLNDLEYFKDKNPSSENIAKYIAQQLDKAINTNAKVFSVSAWESDDACATYIP